MNIQKLNEILDIRRKEMKDLNLSYNFNKYISTCFNRYVDYLKEKDLEHNEDSKNKFLIDMESVIRKKDFNYYRHAIGIIEDINYVHTCKNTIYLILIKFNKFRHFLTDFLQIFFIDDTIDNVKIEGCILVLRTFS